MFLVGESPHRTWMSSQNAGNSLKEELTQGCEEITQNREGKDSFFYVFFPFFCEP